MLERSTTLRSVLVTTTVLLSLTPLLAQSRGQRGRTDADRRSVEPADVTRGTSRRNPCEGPAESLRLKAVISLCRSRRLPVP
jgi:hypothetical protein